MAVMAYISIHEDTLIDIEIALTIARDAALVAKHGDKSDSVPRRVGLDMVLEELEEVLPVVRALLFGPQEAHNATER